MRQTGWFMIVLIAAISGLHAMKLRQACLISGRIFPSAPVTQVMAVRNQDTIHTRLRDGAFVMQVKPGIYSVIINAKPPYKSVMIRKVTVSDGENTNLGEIKIK